MDRVLIDGGTPPPTTTPAVDPNRPAWLPAKFKTPEEFAASYTELERKQSTPATPATPPVDSSKVTEAAQKAGFDLAALNKEYRENGKFSPETLKAMNDKGISSEMVNTYVNGLKAQAGEFRTALAAIAGGDDQLKAVYQWAETNLASEEIDTYNQMVNSNDGKGAKMALSGIVARFTAAHGKEPDLVDGETVPTMGSYPPFESNQQVIDAMNDRRYGTDEAYRAKVMKRMERTTIFSIR